MKLKKFKVNEECISCGACIEIAPNNFEFGENSLAFVKKQPENEQELKATEEAMNVCPVGAIEQINIQQVDKPVLASDNVKDVLDKYPFLKESLIKLSPKFKRLQNPLMYNTLARYTSFSDAAKITGVSICEILHTINKELGTEEKLHKIMPDCIKEKKIDYTSDEITWQEPQERYVYTPELLPTMVEKIQNLAPGKSIVLISVKEPLEIIKLAKGLGYKFNVLHNRDYRISIFNPRRVDIKSRNLPQLDVRHLKEDPFDVIMQKANQTPPNGGFVLIQSFVPYPIINMLAEMNFEYEIEQTAPNEVKVYFYKKPEKILHIQKNKTKIVLQSATPVAYPVIMRLLQSEELNKHFNIKELKIWRETEKHLAWISSGKADISFSALLTSLRIYKFGIKIPAIFVWDNFVLLSRNKIKGFEDLKGQQIHLPLFSEAPPAKITRYLIKATGNNPDDYKFVYGKPFGRPEQIYADFVSGRAHNVVLREPEASYAVKTLLDRNETFSEISFNEIWNKVNPGFGSFPNAGVVFKQEFIKNNPEKIQIFLSELQKAISWVNNNHHKAAELSFDMMRQKIDKVEFFIKRVNFEYKSGEELTKKVKQYFSILYENKIINEKIPENFYDIFKV